MPRFFFHVHDELDAEDPEGLELPDLAIALEGATHAARGLMCETLMQGRITLSHRIDIEDERGRVLATVRFADAVQVKG